MTGPARTVTDSEVATFASAGVVCLRGALDPSLLAAMVEPVETALASRATADLSEMGRGLEAGGVPVLRDGATSGRFASGVDHWREQPEFAAFACESGLPALVAALLGSEHVWLYEDSVLVKEPGAAERTAWHQDLGYFHVDGEQLATTWCPLDPVTPATGAVRYVVGSHRRPETFRPNLFVSDLAIPGTEGPEVPDVDALAAAGACEIVTFTTEPGDVVVHHARTLHAAGPNTSATTRRRAISVRYCGDDARTHLRPGAPRKPHQEHWTHGARLDPAEHPLVHGAPVPRDARAPGTTG
ncbi:MAG: phytanoyl-CoA dioxygenase family protein [Acidimicrobiia bacterium]